MNKEKTVTFFATLAQNKERFWVMQESNPLNLAAMEDEKPMTTRPPSEGANHNTTEKVTSSSTPTENVS